MLWAAGEWRQIKGTITARNPEILLTLYKSLVRPHLEHCVQAWAPFLQQDKDTLKTLQRRVTRTVSGFRHLSYPQRLEALGLFSLDRRRLRGDIIETFTILMGSTDLDPEELFQWAVDSRLRGHRYKINKPRANTRTRANSFAHRVVTPWNMLPDEIFDNVTVESFKRALDRIWDDIFRG